MFGIRERTAMLHCRLQRIETRLQRRSARQGASGPPVVWTAATCVQALRALLAQLAAEPDAAVKDPYPGLEGEAYLLAFWPWLLANGAPWPRWARAYAQQRHGA